ncbi:MAG TPA: hypothetical protein VGN61_11800 [Verrucomicrobiae bacterium]|jgi:hypothetical protein
MKIQKRIAIAATALAAAALTAYATGVTTKIFRTTAYFIGLTQGVNPVTGHLEYVNANFAGRNLVDLAMGRAATDKSTLNQVLAMTFACDLSSANLVVYDQDTSNIVATIASSTSVDSVKQQDKGFSGPNRAHFVAVLQVGQNGNATNGVIGGFFTVAGRVNLNPTTGCPQPVLVLLDRDPLDAVDGDVEIPASDDPDSVPLLVRTGLAHTIGVLDAVIDGSTNTILIPNGHLSIRRKLNQAPSVTSVD